MIFDHQLASLVGSCRCAPRIRLLRRRRAGALPSLGTPPAETAAVHLGTLPAARTSPLLYTPLPPPTHPLLTKTYEFIYILLIVFPNINIFTHEIFIYSGVVSNAKAK